MERLAMMCSLWRLLFAIAGGIALLPLGAAAQTAAKVYRIGWLDLTSPDLRSPSRVAFDEELRLRGYVEGQNLVVEHRNAAGRIDLLPALARELVALRPDLIVAATPPPSRAVKDLTSTIPIVIIGVADPVGIGARGESRPSGRQRDRRDHPRCRAILPARACSCYIEMVPKRQAHRGARQSNQRDASARPAGDFAGGAATRR